MNKQVNSVVKTVSNPLPWVLISFILGFFLCWYLMVLPLNVSLNQREEALKQWEQINRQERQAIGDIKTISIEEVRKWVSTMDEQNTRFSQLQSHLHKQEIALVAPAATHLWISFLIVFCVVGFAVWMMRDSNAEAARTLQSAIAVLPSLREAISDRRVTLDLPSRDAIRLDSNSSKSSFTAGRKPGKIKQFVSDRAYGFIVPDEGGEKLFFHKQNVKRMDVPAIVEGLQVSFVVGVDSSGRTRAEDVEIYG